MRVRAIDGDNDWLYGKGANDYRKDLEAVAQDIKTRLQSFLGDCFFSAQAGIDWFNLLGQKNQLALNLAVSATILNTTGVTGILQLSITLNASRNVRIEYNAQTIYSRTLLGQFTYAIGTLG